MHNRLDTILALNEQTGRRYNNIALCMLCMLTRDRNWCCVVYIRN